MNNKKKKKRETTIITNYSEERISNIITKVESTMVFGTDKSIKQWLDETIEPDHHYIINTELTTGVASDWRLKDKRNDHLGHPLSHYAKEYSLLKLNYVVR